MNTVLPSAISPQCGFAPLPQAPDSSISGESIHTAPASKAGSLSISAVPLTFLIKARPLPIQCIYKRPNEASQVVRRHKFLPTVRKQVGLLAVRSNRGRHASKFIGFPSGVTNFYALPLASLHRSPSLFTDGGEFCNSLLRWPPP